MQDRFLVGAGSTYNPTDTGGALTHSHDLFYSEETGDISFASGPGDFDANTDSKSNLPPYYALAFIMKL